MLSLHDAIDDFLLSLEVEKGRSPNTIENYRRYLYDFLTFVRGETGKDHPTPKQVSQDLVRHYRLSLSRRTTRLGDRLKASTRNYYLIALRSLLKYLHKNDIPSLAPEKIELARHPRPEVSFLTVEQLERLLQSPDPSKAQGLRDLTVLHLLFSTGLRVSELCSLSWSQVNTNTREFRIRGKGGKDRVVFLSPQAALHLDHYRTLRGDDYQPVFINHHAKAQPNDKSGEGLRLTPRTIQRILKKHARRAGIVEDVTPHTLRHTFATDLLRNGADLRSVQEMLGHANVQTTQVYTHVTDQRLREVHERFHSETE